MRREAGYPLSAPLLEELERVAERRGKAILLLNRRGIAPALHCRTCGSTQRCRNCDVSLVLHTGDVLRCHHCGYAESAPAQCPECGSPELARIGAGTQALDRFRQAEGAVLLGTQMVAKGHHFAGVDLAAVLDADLGLGLPDFRAEERTFQLVTQLAGRSGRDAPGRVLVQTFQPDARAITHAARHDVAGFLAGELDRRRALGYPPYGHLVRLLVSGPDPDAPLQALAELRARLEQGVVLGPAPLLRLRGRHRAQLLVKTDAPREAGRRAAQLLSAAAPAMRRAGLTAVVDVDPQSL
jgi:primosomal protein N' (replication factor Y)